MRKNILITVFIAFVIISNAQQKYAVLICGDKPVETPTIVTSPSTWGAPGDSIKNEFWNDTFLMWEMLVFEKGYSDENVFVLYYDGDDYTNDNLANRYMASSLGYPHLTDYPATKEIVEMVFDGLATGTYPFPLVTEDDFLFVWTFGHGLIEESYDGVYIKLFPGFDYRDYMFAQHVNNINCNKRVFWMQQCQSAGFTDDLESTHTFFHSAVSLGQNAAVADDNWDTENEFIGSENYQHGEFNFHMYSSAVGQNPNYEDSYGTELYTDADLNNDNYISVYETWLWEQSHETRNEIPSYSDLGNIGSFTSLEYPTLLHQNITATETYRGLIGISKTIHITQGSQLTFKQNADIVILNNAELIVDEGATLIIEDNVEIRGNINNKIIVNGNVQIGEDVSFEREGNSGYFKGIYFNNKPDRGFFYQCKIP